MLGREDLREARFEALARVVGEPIHRYLLRRIEPDSVDDVLADTLLVLWRRLDDVPGVGDGTAIDADQALPWCYGVARGCLNNARRADQRRLRLVEKLVGSAPVVQVERADHAELYDALRSLGEVDREVVLLWAWEGLLPQAIAEAMGLTPNAVSIRLHRAKKSLAAFLERKNAVPSGQRQGKEGSDL
jgi:RNA polymerase sigma factor (sigma-70 family)